MVSVPRGRVLSSGFWVMGVFATCVWPFRSTEKQSEYSGEQGHGRSQKKISAEYAHPKWHMYVLFSLVLDLGLWI